MSYPALSDTTNTRIHLAAAAITLVAVLIIGRLFQLMILQHDFYTALAAGAHEVYARLIPERGAILLQDWRSGEEFPLAINRDVFVVYADTRKIMNDETAEAVARALAEVFRYDEEKKLSLYRQLNKRTDPYEPIEPRVEEAVVEELRALDLPGIGFVRKPQRVYPEGRLAAHVIGFLGKTEAGEEVGRYGVEGYWQEELAGSGGFFAGEKSAAGRLIPLAGRSVEPAENGADIVLTLDRTLQFMACEKLAGAAKEYQASSGALVILEPKTGAIRALCSWPDFDPNNYNQVDAIEVYNNTAVFTPYEPGSIFKPITMAAAINEGAVTPETVFHDSGSAEARCRKPIKNAAEKSYGNQTMVGVMENSINTGLVFVIKKLGKNKFIDYVERFGFGVKEGVELDSEVSGTIESLREKSGDEVDCYAATAAFGQGITATPLQMATAIGVIANGGKLIKPYVVSEVRYSDGRVERTKPVEIRSVLTARAASLVAGMMVSVVDNGQAKSARVPGYYVAGKTGTAQIPGPGGYTEDTNHSFVGFAPIDDPKFVMVVKFEKPQRKYADSTAAPTFAAIAKFALEYYGVPPGR